MRFASVDALYPASLICSERSGAKFDPALDNILLPVQKPSILYSGSPAARLVTKFPA